MSEDSERKTEEDGTFTLSVKQLTGAVVTLNVGWNEKFKAIKARIARKTGIRVEEQRLVFRGAMVGDDDTPRGLGCERDSCMHLARHITTLNSVITKPGLVGNCMHCHTEGVQFALRLLCSRCLREGTGNPEAVRSTSDIVEGTTKWKDIVDMKTVCLACQMLMTQERERSGNYSPVPEEEFTHPAAMGFLCLQETDGHVCISRRRRDMQNTYDGSGSEALQAIINKHFGYAHAGGLPDRA